MVSRRSAALLLSLRDYFDMIDSDGKGELDSTELRVAIDAMGEVCFLASAAVVVEEGVRQKRCLLTRALALGREWERGRTSRALVHKSVDVS
jgi:hypothetical protein